MSEIESILRSDLCSFIGKGFHTLNPNTKYLHNWHIEAIAAKLEAVTRGEIKRLIINMPPRYLKSICASVAWPAWLLGHDPSRRVIVASHNSALSVKHSLDTRKIMQGGWYKKIFPQVKFARDQNEKTKFMTSESGFRMAASVGAGITGEGGNFLIIDDPIAAQDAHSDHARNTALSWFDQSFSTRLDDKKNGAIIVVMQRLHDEDLSGVLLRRGGWEHLCLPVYDDGMNLLHGAREGMAEIKKLRGDLGEYGFAAQYLQAPHKTEGGVIRRSWLVFYEFDHHPSLREGQGEGSSPQGTVAKLKPSPPPSPSGRGSEDNFSP